MTTLVIAEKPDVASKIAQAIIGNNTRKDGYFEGNGYIVTFAVGHLLGLADPETYNDRYEKWNLDDLPIIPERFLLTPNTNTAKQLKIIGKLAQECSELVNACDAGISL